MKTNLLVQYSTLNTTTETTLCYYYYGIICKLCISCLSSYNTVFYVNCGFQKASKRNLNVCMLSSAGASVYRCVLNMHLATVITKNVPNHSEVNGAQTSHLPHGPIQLI
jgi:hypothetical protein